MRCAPASPCSTRSTASTPERRATGHEPIAIGIGLNTGSLMLGTIGERHRMDGTVISDAVNLAARIESLTKNYQGGLLISQYTYEQLADPKAYDIRPIDVVVVKGKTRPVTIFEVFQPNPPAERAAKGAPATCCSRASTRSPITMPRPPGAVSRSAWRWRRAMRRPGTC